MTGAPKSQPGIPQVIFASLRRPQHVWDSLADTWDHHRSPRLQQTCEIPLWWFLAFVGVALTLRSPRRNQPESISIHTFEVWWHRWALSSMPACLGWSTQVTGAVGLKVLHLQLLPFNTHTAHTSLIPCSSFNVEAWCCQVAADQRDLTSKSEIVLIQLSSVLLPWSSWSDLASTCESQGKKIGELASASELQGIRIEVLEASNRSQANNMSDLASTWVGTCEGYGCSMVSWHLCRTQFVLKSTQLSALTSQDVQQLQIKSKIKLKWRALSHWESLRVTEAVFLLQGGTMVWGGYLCYLAVTSGDELFGGCSCADTMRPWIARNVPWPAAEWAPQTVIQFKQLTTEDVLNFTLVCTVSLPCLNWTLWSLGVFQCFQCFQCFPCFQCLALSGSASDHRIHRLHFSCLAKSWTVQSEWCYAFSNCYRSISCSSPPSWYNFEQRPSSRRWWGFQKCCTSCATLAFQSCSVFFNRGAFISRKKDNDMWAVLLSLHRIRYLAWGGIALLDATHTWSYTTQRCCFQVPVNREHYFFPVFLPTVCNA